MISLETLLKDSARFDQYITKFEGNPEEFNSIYDKFIFLARKSAEKNLLSENEFELVQSPFFEDAVRTSDSLYKICLEVFIRTKYQKSTVEPNLTVEEEQEPIPGYVIKPNIDQTTDSEKKKSSERIKRLVKSGDFELLEQELITNNSGINVRDFLDTTHLMYAVMSKNYQIVELLCRYGADIYVKNTTGNTAYSLSRGENKNLFKRIVRNMGLPTDERSLNGENERYAMIGGKINLVKNT